MLCVSDLTLNIELCSPDERSDSIVLGRAIQELRQQPGLDWTIMNLKVTLNFFSHDTTNDKKSSLDFTTHSLIPAINCHHVILKSYILICIIVCKLV